jgi:hypothetical protein
MSSAGTKCVECLDLEIVDRRGRATRHAVVNWRRNLRIFEAALARNDSREQTQSIVTTFGSKLSTVVGNSGRLRTRGRPQQHVPEQALIPSRI